MRIRGLHSLTIRVRPFAAVLAFYRDVLGLTPTALVAGRFARLRCGQATLEIEAVQPGEPAGPPQHFGLAVTPAVLESAPAALDAHGVAPLPVGGETIVRLMAPDTRGLFLRDPAGHLVALSARSAGAPTAIPGAPGKADSGAQGLAVTGLACVGLAALDLPRMEHFLGRRLGLRRAVVDAGREVYTAGEAAVVLVEAGRPWWPDGPVARPWPLRFSLLIDGKRGYVESIEGHRVDLVPAVLSGAALQ